jgi:hypothetical protein
VAKPAFDFLLSKDAKVFYAADGEAPTCDVLALLLDMQKKNIPV